MVVYWEYAFLENFMLDGLIVFLALSIARCRIRVWRLILASAAGAAEAIVFPLIPFPIWCAYLVKFLGGALICVIAVSKGRLKTYALVTTAFFLITFAFGGLLTAAYSFFRVEYEEGNGYLVEGAPVSFVFTAAGIFAVFVWIAAKKFYKFRKLQKNLLRCTLAHGGRSVHWKGLCDSGNLLRFRGKPVCVFSSVAAFALFGRNLAEVGRLEIKTVNGVNESPVFLCERMTVVGRIYENVYLTVGEVSSKDYQLILHSEYWEENNETVKDSERLAETHGGKRERRSLPVRK